jgi:hypothetical protein
VIKSRLPLAVCAAILLALVAPAAALAGDLDQQQTDGSGGLVAIYASQSLAQTFTAGQNGQLDQVDMDIKKGGAPTSLTVELRNVVAGAPGTQVLAGTSVPGSGVTTTLGFVPVHFSTPGAVTAGTQYAVVAYTGAIGSDYFQWGEQGPDPYAGGTATTSFASPPTTTWSPSSWDYAFKTYVSPPSPPSSTPAQTGQRAAALKKCKKKRTAKARKKCRKRAKKLPL